VGRGGIQWKIVLDGEGTEKKEKVLKSNVDSIPLEEIS
jgi:hypothetical protein